MSHHHPHPAAHLGHPGPTDPYGYNGGQNLHSSLTRPRSRNHLEMADGAEDLRHPHHSHHIPQGQHHYHHPHSSIHPPPPNKMHKGSDYDMLSRTSLPLGPPNDFMSTHTASLHAGGSPATVYGTGLPPMPNMLNHDLGRSKMETEDERMERRSQSASSNTEDVSPGAPGMPQAMPRPLGPKLKFTQDDDALLVELKENRSLSWKQIADYFPGRTSGTLQVRYCTKLKAKTVMWNDEMVQRLKNAVQEHEADRWRHIATKVGNGFTPAACREKSREVLGTDHRD